MHQGAQGAWTFHLPYTSEDEYQGSGLALMFYILLGKLAPLGLSYPLLYHGARLFSSLLLLFVLARFIARFITDHRWQTWTWWLVLFSGGVGLVVSYLINPAYVAYELVAPDAFAFSILYGPPHVILGYALLLIWIEYVLNTLSMAANRQRMNGWLWRRIVMANLLGLLTALSREAYGPAFVGIMLAYLIALLIRQRKIPWRAALITAASCLGAGVYGVYMLVAYRIIPAFAAWYRQNPFASPDLLDFLVGSAPLLILAAIGLYLIFARPQPDRAIASPLNCTFLLAWLVIGPIIAYLPLAISRRLVIGWQIPLSIFGAYTLLRLWESRRPLRRALALSALAATALTTLLVIFGGSMLVSMRQPPLFQSADQLAALSWLGGHTTDRDVVLSDWHFGNALPVYAGARVLSGHPIETIDFQAKNALIDRYFAPSTSETDRQALIDQWSITLVVATPDRFVPTDRTTVFQAGAYRIYHAHP